MTPPHDPDDDWFYAPEWQAGMREAEADIAAGRVTVHNSDEEFLTALRERRKPGDETTLHLVEVPPTDEPAQ